MRKDKGQQKKAQVQQLELFSSRTSEPVRAVIGGTDRTLLSGIELSSRSERQRTFTENILEKVVDYENLKIKWFAQQGLQSLWLRMMKV
jgi:hypothetical protein